MTNSKQPPIVHKDRLKEIVEDYVRRLFEESAQHFLEGYLKHISSEEMN